MKGTRIGSFAMTALAGMLAVGCASSGATPPRQSAPAPGPDSLARLEALYLARIDSSRMRFTEADVRFMTAMIAHHAQAITMSRLVPDRTTTRSMQVLAARIINAQQDEIASMQQWLRDRRQSVPELHVMGNTVMVHGDHALHAPGMLTDEQMQQLERARGAEFDRLFLAFMIQHHRGAVAMVRELFATDGAGQDEEVFKLAADVEADQTSEITRMELMLEALTGAGGRL